MKRQSSILRAALLVLVCATAAPAALAHTGTTQDKAHGKTPAKGRQATPVAVEEKTFGRPGDPRKVNRTIFIDMRDSMRFGPSEIRIRQGETVKFVVRNKGKLLHEIVLGTMDELKAHGEMMKKHPGMEHDEPYMAHVSPAGKQDLVWQFTEAGEFHYACLIPGHFEAGMVGKITVIKE